MANAKRTPPVKHSGYEKPPQIRATATPTNAGGNPYRGVIPDANPAGVHGRPLSVRMDGPNADHRNTADPRIEVQRTPGADLGPNRVPAGEKLSAAERGSGRA